MRSEFYNVALDRIRYSLVWEDSTTLYNSLDISCNDHVLVITSAGCNVLNALLKNPKSVTAIDLNPVQNLLLGFKMHVISNHDYATFQNILGINGQGKVMESFMEIASTLSGRQVRYWAKFFEDHPKGILTSGKLEDYLTGFYQTLQPEIKAHVERLITFADINEQVQYFSENLDNSVFKPKFIQYFDETNLSKGRDAKLFKYASESSGETFYNRLSAQISSSLVSNNFFFRLFFWGVENLSQNLLPPCYLEENYRQLRENIDKIKIIESEAIDFLVSDAGKYINKASLSNIFEYTSKEEFDMAYQQLFTKRNSPLKIVFWNLLNEQGCLENLPTTHTSITSTSLATEHACFYFCNTCVIENSFEYNSK